MKYFIGVDGGKTGAWGLISQDLKDIAVFDFPKELSELVDHFEDILEEYDIGLAALEKQKSAPRQGAPATFTHGENYGMWQAAFAFTRIPYVIVDPRTWMYDTFDSIKRKDETKVISIAHAKRRFPTAPVGKNHNRADGLNIALYARNKFING